MRTESIVKKILPVNLMLENKRCLVVGGGSIAARKVEHLLEAGARVTVVSDEVCSDIGLWKKDKRITVSQRAFRPADMKGCFLIFAATNDVSVNNRIVKACQRKGVLCCAVDANWADGNFVTPATFRHPALTLTVSTGGESCRRARMIKDYFVRHIDMVTSADLLVLSVRRRPAGTLGQQIQSIWGVHEFIIIEEGPRLEVFAIASLDPVVEQMLRSVILGGARQSSGIQVMRGPAALAYTEKLGRQGKAGFAAAERIRGAMEKSVREKWAGPMMRDWLQAAIHQTAPGYAAENTTHAIGLVKPVAGDKTNRYELIIRGFQGRDSIQ